MDTKMSEPRDLFLHELGDVLYAEQTLVKALPNSRKKLPTRSSRRASMSILKRRAST